MVRIVTVGEGMPELTGGPPQWPARNLRATCSTAPCTSPASVTEVSLLWSEPDGSRAKPHVQTEIKAVVAPAPYSEVARDSGIDG